MEAEPSDHKALYRRGLSFLGDRIFLGELVPWESWNLSLVFEIPNH